jgi:hypothetical protein
LEAVDERKVAGENSPHDRLASSLSQVAATTTGRRCPAQQNRMDIFVQQDDPGVRVSALSMYVVISSATANFGVYRNRWEIE